MQKRIIIGLLTILMFVSCVYAAVYHEPWSGNQDGNQHNLTDMDYIQSNNIEFSQANHTINDNSTCITITAGTTTLNICE